MTRQRVLIDTGAIFAFVVRSDKHHEAAKSFVEGWIEQDGVFVLGDMVFAETMTLMKARISSTVAVQVGDELRRNPAYSWVALGEAGERDAWAVFQRFGDKEWSYTDCAILALARREKIRQVFAFDHHFSQMPDLERVP